MKRPSPRGATAAGARPRSAPAAWPNRRSRYQAVRRPSTEVAPPLNPRLWAAGPRPSAQASFHADSPRPLFPTRPARFLRPLQSPALRGQGSYPAPGPLTWTEPPPVHPAWVLLCVPWAASPLAGCLAEAAVLAPEPPLRQALPPGLVPLLGLHPHLGHLLSSTFALHPSLSPAVLALQARKKRTKAKKDKAQRK